jgi:uncharacterized protein YecE (DUF72 family)
MTRTSKKRSDRPSAPQPSSSATPRKSEILPNIRIGPAGWSYSDWSGYVYPSPCPKGFHEASYLAQFFDTIEINTSFYQPLRPEHAAQWLDRVAANPNFLFTAKLWQKFTHDESASPISPPRTPPGSADDDEHAVRAGFDVLHKAGKLGAVLLQFPFSFHRTAGNFAYLATLLKRFTDYPLAVEVRHASWNHPEVFAMLREHSAAFCSIDQPIIGRSLEPSDESTSALGYIRLHGRRYDTWFSDDPAVPQHERYNYLYSAEELAPWASRIRKAAANARNVFVVTNNHYLGKAVVNALQLLSMLQDRKVKVPEPLRQHYPELEAIADTPPAQPTLFPLANR